MEENNNSSGCLIAILVVALIWALFFHQNTYEGQTAEEWFNEYDQTEADLEDYKTALEEANSNIEDANSKIRNAQYCSWGCTYTDMQNAINDLDTIDTVSEP